MGLKKVSFILVITAILVACNIYTLIPLYRPISLDFHVQTADIVLGSSFFTFFYAFGLLSFGPVSERVGRKKVIVTGLLFSAFTTAMVAFSNDPATLFIARGIQGFSLGSFAPVAFAYTFELFPPKQRTLILALINTSFLLAGMLGQIMSAFIEDISNWRTVFFLFSALYVFLFFVALSLPVPHKRPLVQHNIWKSFFVHLKNKQLLKYYAITFTILFSFVSFYESIAVHMEDETAIHHDSLLWLRAVGLAGTCLSLFTNRLILCFGGKTTLSFGLALAISALLLIASFPYPLVIAVASIFFVGAVSLLIPSIITLIGNAATADRGSAISLYSFILLIGASIAPFAASSFSLSGMMLLLAFVFFISFFVNEMIKPPSGL